MSGYKSLLSPLTIRDRTFRNRVLSTAHAPSYTDGGAPAERYQASHEEKVKGVNRSGFAGGSEP